MKPSMAIKPLVFAIAAVMAVAAQADQNDRRGGHGHNNNPRQMDRAVYTNADATATDSQRSTGNSIRNEGTINEAEMSSSGAGASGNVGVNVAAGNGNQQDNAAAIANTSSDNADIDNSFVFGTATASADVVQRSNNNVVNNWSTQSSAVMSGSADGEIGRASCRERV